MAFAQLSHDLLQSRQSLLALLELARRHPALAVRLGHQTLEDEPILEH